MCTTQMNSMNIMLPTRHVNIGIIGLLAQDNIPKSGFQPKLHPLTGKLTGIRCHCTLILSDYRDSLSLNTASARIPRSTAIPATAHSVPGDAISDTKPSRKGAMI
jgi:hypothetical protein